MILKRKGHLCLVLDYRATNLHADLGPAVSFSEVLDVFNLLCCFHLSPVKNELECILSRSLLFTCWYLPKGQRNCSCCVAVY